MRRLVENTVKVAMKNHSYNFEGETHLQGPGAPIGNPLAGSVARVTMTDCDVIFLAWLKKVCTNPLVVLILCELYNIYLDDQLGAHQPIPPGYWWDPAQEKVTFSQEHVEEDSQVA